MPWKTASWRPAKNKFNVRERYDHLAGTYDRRWKGYVESTLGAVLQQLKLTGAETVLDIGCGTGALEHSLVSRHPNLKITGVDLSEKMLSVARRKLQACPNVDFVAANASGLPFPNESFDRVICASAFHYFDEPQTPVLEMRRVLKPGGKLILLDWCKDYLFCRVCDILFRAFNPDYAQCYTQKELSRFLKNGGFQVSSERKFRSQAVWGMAMIEAVKL